MEYKPLMRQILGITGSIASGKSIFCKILAEQGCTFIDSDRIVHELYKPGNKGYEALVKNKTLKPKVPINSDKTINMDKLRTLIFGRPLYREKIEKIIHPLVTAEIKKSIKNAPKDINIAIEMPLLFEKKLEGLVDLTIVVQSPIEQVMERVMKKFGISKEDALKILNAQMPVSEKLYKADVIVLNNGDMEELKEKAKTVLVSL
jgi:dephospho-CoA kinase